MTEKLEKKILEKIKIYMLKNSISQKEMAKKLGVSPQAISHFINGRNSPSLNTIKSFSEALGVSANYFFSDDSITQNISGNHNQMHNANGADFELLKTQLEVLKKGLENIELRVKILEKKK